MFMYWVKTRSMPKSFPMKDQGRHGLTICQVSKVWPAGRVQMGSTLKYQKHYWFLAQCRGFRKWGYAKWIVYKDSLKKSCEHGWFGGTHISGNLPVQLSVFGSSCMENIDCISTRTLTVYVWTNCNNSLTWNKTILRWFLLLTMIPARSQWGRFYFPNTVYVYIYISLYINRLKPLLDVFFDLRQVGIDETWHTPFISEWDGWFWDHHWQKRSTERNELWLGVKMDPIGESTGISMSNHVKDP